MRSPLAFFASLGASAALLAAVAATLLTVSTFVALQGWPGLGDDAAPRPALVVDAAAPVRGSSGAPARARTASRRAVVLRAPAARSRPVARARQQARVRPIRSAVGRGDNLAGSRLPAATSPPPPPAEAPGRQPAPQAQGGTPTGSAPRRSGDGVRKVGEDLSGGVTNAGQALNDVAAPLSPGVGQTLEELTKLIAALLRNTTNIVGAALDRLAPAR